MCKKEDLKAITDQLVAIYRNVYGDDIDRILLYGSYARGDSRDDSDIDVVAIVSGDRSQLQQKLKTVWNEAADLGVLYDAVISPTVIPLDEFNQHKDTLPYYRNIDKEGVLLT